MADQNDGWVWLPYMVTGLHLDACERVFFTALTALEAAPTPLTHRLAAEARDAYELLLWQWAAERELVNPPRLPELPALAAITAA